MEELIEQAKKGDKEAFTQLIISIEYDLYKIAKMRLYCEDDINDAVQETIIQTFKSIKKIKYPEYFKTWVIKVLINNCNKIYKKNKKIKNVEYNEETMQDLYSIDGEKSIENLDFFILIKDLSYKERLSLILYYLENLTTKEISKILKESEGATRSRISRTKNKLKEKYEGGEYNGRYRKEDKKHVS